MSIAIAVSITGTPTEFDIRAAQKIVNAENVRRAALTPPGTPLALATTAQLAASYSTVLAALLTASHADYSAQASYDSFMTNYPRWLAATDAQRAAASADLPP